MDKAICIVFLTLFFLSGTFYVTDVFKTVSMGLLAVSILILWVISRGAEQNQKLLIRTNLIFSPYILFTVSILLAALFHLEPSMFVTVIGLLAIWVATTRIFPNCERQNLFRVENVALYLSIAMLLVFAYSLLTERFVQSRYEGIFANPNSCGGAAATLFAFAISGILGEANKKRIQKSKVAIFVVALVTAVIFTFVSTSRTSVLTIALLSILAFALFAKDNLSDDMFLRALTVFLVLIVAIVLLLKFSNLGDWVDTILWKFDAKSADTLDGREAKWEFVFGRLAFLGNGEASSFGAHNTYFSLLDQYGIPAFIAWILFVVAGIFRSLQFAIGDNRPMRYFPLFVFLAFASMSMTEGMMLKTIMLSSVFSYALVNGCYSDTYISQDTSCSLVNCRNAAPRNSRDILNYSSDMRTVGTKQ